MTTVARSRSQSQINLKSVCCCVSVLIKAPVRILLITISAACLPHINKIQFNPSFTFDVQCAHMKDQYLYNYYSYDSSFNAKTFCAGKKANAKIETKLHSEQFIGNSFVVWCEFKAKSTTKMNKCQRFCDWFYGRNDKLYNHSVRMKSPFVSLRISRRTSWFDFVLFPITAFRRRERGEMGRKILFAIAFGHKF